MGVTKRTDPHESVMGGSLYLQKILDRLPESIPITDKTWMSLAAYNTGFKHLKATRNLAKKMGKNPNSWNEVNKVLPLHLEKTLTLDKKVTNQRAQEIIDYVDKIKLFYKTLVLMERKDLVS